jgi:hypothetical protein
MNDQELERRYGPAASYSDYRRGERIVFSEAGQIYSGIIIWVCAPQQRFSSHTPISYVVETDVPDTHPLLVWPGDIIQPAGA